MISPRLLRSWVPSMFPTPIDNGIPCHTDYLYEVVKLIMSQKPEGPCLILPRLMQQNYTMRVLPILILIFGLTNLIKTAFGQNKDDDAMCGKTPKNHIVVNCAKAHAAKTCRKEVCDRFHCCPQDLDLIDTSKKAVRYVSCDPISKAKIVDDNIDPPEDRKELSCDCLEVSEVGGEKGRCKIPEEEKRKVKRLEEYYDRDTEEALNIWEREIWTLPHNLQRKYTFGQECDIGLYNERKMGEFWDRFLLCPLDHEYFRTFMKKILNEALFFPDILKKLCLASENLEECVRDASNPKEVVYRCGCLQRKYNFRRKSEKKGDPCVFPYHLNQINEGLKCGQLAGQTCQFNWRDLRRVETITEACPSEAGAKSPHELLAACEVKGGNLPDSKLSSNLACEEDAICVHQNKPQGVCQQTQKTEDCKCTCVQGHKCKGTNRGVLVKASIPFSFLLTMMVIL